MSRQIISRRPERVAAEEFLDAAAGGARALLLEGEAGIGKTLLWQEALERARARGFRVLSARPAGSEVELSFAALGDLLDGALELALPELPAPRRRALETALLLAEPEGPAPDQRAVALAFLGALRILAGSGPLLVAVDDLQWLDASSGSVLAFAARRLGDEPVALLAAARATPGAPVPFALDRAFPEGSFRRLALGPLSVGAVHELLRTRLGLTLPRWALARVHEAAGGNPLFALEIGRELTRQGSQVSPEEPLPVPVDLRELMRDRLARLSEHASDALLAAAALSQPTASLVEEVASEPAPGSAGLEEGLRAGVVELEGERVVFSHPLLRSVCYANAGPSRRRAVHARLAEAVSDPEERARHLALAAEAPDGTV